MDARYTRLLKNSGIVFMGNIGSKMISFILLPIYTAYMSTSEFGTSDIINTYTSIFLSVVSCCLADAIFVYPKESDDSNKKKYFTTGLIFSLASFVCVSTILLAIDALTQEVDFSFSLIKYRWWILLITFSLFIQSYNQQFCRSIDRMFVYSASGLVLTLCLSLFAILLLPRYGLQGYLFSIFISNLIASFFTFIFAREYTYLGARFFSRTHLRSLLLYGVPLIPNSVMWWLINGINRPIMEAEIGLSEIGIYAVANKFPSIITVIYGIFSTAWAISIIEEFKSKDFNSFFNKSTRAVTFLTILVGCTITIFSKPIVTIFADANFYDAWQYIPILTMAAIFQSLSSIVGCVFMAQKKSQYFFYSSLIGGASSLIFTFILIKFWGLYGVCIAVVISFLFMLGSRVYYAWNYINQLDIVYYMKMFVIYGIFIILNVMDANAYICICSYLISIILIAIMNKDIAKKTLLKSYKYISHKRLMK